MMDAGEAEEDGGGLSQPSESTSESPSESLLSEPRRDHGELLHMATRHKTSGRLAWYWSPGVVGAKQG